MSSFTIGKKLFTGITAMLLCTLILGLSSFLNLSTISGHTNTMAGTTLQKQQLASRIRSDTSELLAVNRGIEVRGYMKDLPTIEKYNRQFGETADDTQSSIDVLSSLASLPKTKDDLRQIQEALAVMRPANELIYKHSAAGEMDQAIAVYVNPFLPAQKRLQVAAADISAQEDQLMTSDKQSVIDVIETSRWINGGMLLLSLGVGACLVFVVFGITRSLRANIQELDQSSVQIASSANQVAASSQSLAEGSSQQAATIQETSSSSAEINSMARRSTENSRRTSDIAGKSQEGIVRTNQSISEMLSAMENIDASGQKISKIIKVIDEIAFQTNILALNAAVEAARAGEAGMGFAVVADEVRSLAQRCAQAANDTAVLIEGSLESSQSGRVKVDQVALDIRSITADSTQIGSLVDEIKLGSIEQSRGIEHISQAIIQLEKTTQSSAANAEQGAAAAQELNAQADSLRNVTSQLRIMVDGRNHLAA